MKFTLLVPKIVSVRAGHNHDIKTGYKKDLHVS